MRGLGLGRMSRKGVRLWGREGERRVRTEREGVVIPTSDLMKQGGYRERLVGYRMRWHVRSSIRRGP